MYHTFFELLRYALGTSKCCPPMRLCEWREVFEIAKKQTVAGFIASALKSCGDGVLIDTDECSKGAFEALIMDWMGEAMKAERRNLKVNSDVVSEFHKLESLGLECCLLKGQGNAMLYPIPGSRTPGDIDVWVRFKGAANTDERIREIIKLIRREKPNAKATYHHIDASDINGTPVEVHYRPQFLFYYRHNKALQNFFMSHADEQFAHKVILCGCEIAVPTSTFNVVFQLSHIYNHLFHEGIGLRQIIDYYYVLKEYALLSRSTNAKDNTSQFGDLLQSMGLLNIARALMWILVTMFGMEREWAVVELDEKRGRFVLNEVLRGGNFGRNDNRYNFGNSSFGKNMQRLCRDGRLLSYFPTEALSEPLFRLWHAWWRKNYNHRFCEMKVFS